MRIATIACLLLLPAWTSAFARDGVGTIDLGGTWQMKDLTRGVGVTRQVYLPGKQPQQTLPIRIPGTVRTALLEAGEIPDPYLGYDNEKSLWVEDKEWWFFRTFDVARDVQGRFVDLVFEGSSFRGEVWLNGQLVGPLEGMLNPKAFDVSRLLSFGATNSLVVRLEATPDARVNLMARGLTWDMPRDQLFSIAQCMYGWDWGPHGVPVGLWQPVKLRVTGPLRASRPYVRARLDSPSSAVVTVDLDVTNLAGEPKQATLAGTIAEKGSLRTAADFKQVVELAAGETRTASFEVRVRNPRLWWPNGMGEQSLYLISATLSDGAEVSDGVKAQFGIRELKLVANENVEEFEKTMKEQTGSVYHLGRAVGSYPWTFQVNGKKMFAKGGNWIPVDQLLRLDRDRYDRLLRLARDAHFNLLRVWGGGLYETDDFYELCDEYGILAWQEFLSNRSFSKIDRESFMEGAEAAVVRLRNHPSLTFWCGGNEFDPDDQGSKAVIDALDALLKRLDPEREFHRASPYKGDDHYWGVWHGQQPYTRYRIVRPFRSEAGVNTFPVLEDFQKFTPQDQLWPLDPTFVEYHGEYNPRFKHLDKLARYADEFGASSTLASFVMKSQLYQALADAFNMEYCRSNSFRNSGVLIWQYNDIWPTVSWSIVDWYGTPKPSYYFLKRAARPLHVSADYEKYLWKAGETFAADVHLLNDTQAPAKGLAWRASILDVTGKVLATKSGPAAAEANRSATLGRVDLPLSPEMAGRTVFVAVQLTRKDGSAVSDALYPIAVSRSGNPDEYKDIFAELNGMEPVALQAELLTPALKLDSSGSGALSLRLTNPTTAPTFFVRARFLEESETLRSSYSDNYVSLLPGEAKTIEVTVQTRGPEAVPTTLQLEVSGWNVAARKLAVAVAASAR